MAFVIVSKEFAKLMLQLIFYFYEGSVSYFYRVCSHEVTAAMLEE